MTTNAENQPIPYCRDWIHIFYTMTMRPERQTMSRQGGRFHVPSMH